LQIGRRVENLLRHLGRAADGEAVILADDRGELVGGLAGDLVDLDAALTEDLRGLGVHFVADEDFGHVEKPFAFSAPAKAGVQDEGTGRLWPWAPAFAGARAGS